MQNLILFFIRNNAFFAFLFLEFIALYILIENNHTQNTAYQAATGAMAARVYKITGDIKQYQNLSTVNEQLADENAHLKEQLESSYFNHRVDTQEIKDKVYQQQYRYTTAQIVNNSVSRQNNYITLNRGRMHGVKPNCAVVAAVGCVGIVKSVSEHYSIVISLLNRKTQLSAKISRTGDVGQLTWNGLDPLVMTMAQVSKQAKIKLGDSIITSGSSNMFPAGIYIGKVRAHEVDSGSPFHSIQVELAADLNKINHVFIVDNLFRNEAAKLEEEAIANEQ
jgi:rod shape-determining protein MreC